MLISSVASTIYWICFYFILYFLPFCQDLGFCSSMDWYPDFQFCAILLGKIWRQATLSVQRNPIKSNQTKLKCPCFIKCSTLRWLREWQGRQKTREHMQNPWPCVLPLGAHLNTLWGWSWPSPGPFQGGVRTWLGGICSPDQHNSQARSLVCIPRPGVMLTT